MMWEFWFKIWLICIKSSCTGIKIMRMFAVEARESLGDWNKKQRLRSAVGQYVEARESLGDWNHKPAKRSSLWDRRGSQEPWGLKFCSLFQSLTVPLSRLARALGIEIIHFIPSHHGKTVEARASLEKRILMLSHHAVSNKAAHIKEGVAKVVSASP